MTDKPTPKEIEDLFVEETGFATDDFPAAILDFARAVLAKWGQPAQAADNVPAPVPPPECETEAEKRAFAFGWLKALESERMKADNKKKDPL